MRIWKFILPPLNSNQGGYYTFTIEMPLNRESGVLPRLLRIAQQPEGVGHWYLWAVVDPDKPVAPFEFYASGTGHGAVNIEDNYIGTVFDTHRGQSLVWHVFSKMLRRM